MAIKLNRKKFYAGYSRNFGKISDQRTVDGLNFILDKFENETRLTTIPQHAYVLATAKHESTRDSISFQPLKEKRAGSRQPSIRAIQDKYWYTNFYGRGLIQITWEDNYRKLGKILGVGDAFVKNPDLVLQPNYAYEILIVGMVQGEFRKDSKKRKQTLARYVNENNVDYFEAREVVNGDKNKTYKGNPANNGTLIADSARKFERILKASLLAVDEVDLFINAPVEVDVDSPDETNLDAALPEPEKSPEENAQPVILEKEEPVVSTAAKAGDVLNKTYTWLFFGGGAVIVSGWFEKFTGVEINPAAIQIIFNILIVIGIAAILYIIGRFIITDRREKRAHELNVATLRAAAEPGLNTVHFRHQPQLLGLKSAALTECEQGE